MSEVLIKGALAWMCIPLGRGSSVSIILTIIFFINLNFDYIAKKVNNFKDEFFKNFEFSKKIN